MPPLDKIKRKPRAAIGFNALLFALRQWCDRVNVKRATGRHCSCHFHMLAFMTRNCRRILDSDYLLIFVRNQDRLLTGLDTLLRTLSVCRIRALCCALGIADPSIPATVFRSSHGDHAA